MNSILHKYIIHKTRSITKACGMTYSCKKRNIMMTVYFILFYEFIVHLEYTSIRGQYS